MATTSDNIYVDVGNIPSLQQIYNEDSMVLETKTGTNFIEFKDFVIQPDNTTFYSEITQTLSYIQSLCTNTQTLSNNIFNYPTINGGLVISGNYSEMRTINSQGRGWRWVNMSDGTAHGSLILQGSTDNFNTSFIDAMTISNNGDVNINNTLNVVENLELGTNALIDRECYLDISAQPGSNADARIYRGAGANGDYKFLNGGTGSFNLHAGGATNTFAGGKGLTVYSNGNVHSSASLKTWNNQAIKFTDNLGSTSPGLYMQSDNNIVLYGSNSIGGIRPIFACFARSDNSALFTNLPFQLGTNGTPITTMYSVVGIFPGNTVSSHNYITLGITVTGATTNSFVLFTLGAGGTGSGFLNLIAYVNSANSVLLRVQNVSNSSQTFSNFYYRVTVFNF